MNISNLLAQHAAAFPEQLAAVSVDKTTTYAHLNGLVNRVANAFIEYGIHKGDKVAVYMPNIKEAIVLNFAIQRVGAIVIPLPAHFSQAHVAYVLSHSDAQAIFVHDTLYEVAESISFEGLKVKTGLETEEWMSFEEFAQIGDDSVVRSHLTAQDYSTLLYVEENGQLVDTLLTNRDLLSIADTAIQQLNITAAHQVFVLLPLAHIEPLLIFLTATVKTNAQGMAIFSEAMTPEQLAHYVKSYKPTHVVGTFASLQQLAAVMKPDELATVQRWIYDGKRLPSEDEELLQSQLDGAQFTTLAFGHTTFTASHLG